MHEAVILPDQVARLVQGDHEALAEIFRSTATAVHRVAYRILRQNDSADDVVQDTYIRLFEIRARLDPCRSVMGLLLRIACNLATDRLRRRRRELPLESDAPSGAATLTPRSGAEAPVEVIDLRAALRRLAPQYEAPLLLRYGEGLSYSEIADALDISAAAVGLRLHRAKAMLRNQLGPRGRRTNR